MNFNRKIRRNKAKELAKKTGLPVNKVWPYFRDGLPSMKAEAAPEPEPAMIAAEPDASGNIPGANVYEKPASVDTPKPGLLGKVKLIFNRSK